MHKPSPSRLNLISAIAASIGMMGAIPSTAEVFRQQRGPAPAGKKWRDHGIYIPGGSTPNVEPTKVKNPKVAAQVQGMHEAWEAKRSTMQGIKREPDPRSITSIKRDLHCHRAIARDLKRRADKKAEGDHVKAY